MTLSIKTVIKQDAILKAMVTDVGGRLRELMFPIRFLEELCDTGLAFDGSSFEGINTVNDADAILVGVLETLVECPENIQTTDKKEFWIICNIYDTDGNIHEKCVRGKLIELQKQLSETWNGGKMFIGAEPEGYLVQDKTKLLSTGGGNSSYFDSKSDITHIIGDIANTLELLDYSLERAHTEVGAEQFEINWKYDVAERTADKIQIYKLVCLKIARLYGYDVTFLPKPYPDRNGSGMHFHISVNNSKENLFFDEANEKSRYFSDGALSFLQNILDNMRSMSAVANKTEASYARLVPGFEAPVVIAIASKNRSVACRIPAVEDPKKLKKGIRAEFRFPDPLANPYLLASSFIILGKQGIEKNVKFKKFTNKNLYSLSLQQILDAGFKILPRNLGEALLDFSKSTELKKQLGEGLFESYRKIILDEIYESQPYANTYSTYKHFL